MEGPGTIWETWNEGGSSSRNHPALAASIGVYLYSLAGVDASTWPSPEHVHLSPGGGDPSTARKLGGAAGSVASIRGGGRVEFDWSLSDARLAANVTVPHGSESARVMLPVPLLLVGKDRVRLADIDAGVEQPIDLSSAGEVHLGGGLAHNGVRAIAVAQPWGDRLVVDLAQGRYRFTLA